MKLFVVFLTLFLSSIFARACDGEAQIIARIETVKISMTSCKAFVDLLSVKFYAPNRFCPLDIADIASEGVEVGLKNGHDCRLEPGDELNGTVSKNKGGHLILE